MLSNLLMKRWINKYSCITGYFGQNLPYPGFAKPWGYVQSMVLIIFSAGGLWVYLRRRHWL